jgi:hypothetical protein
MGIPYSRSAVSKKRNLALSAVAPARMRASIAFTDARGQPGSPVTRSFKNAMGRNPLAVADGKVLPLGEATVTTCRRLLPVCAQRLRPFHALRPEDRG